MRLLYTKQLKVVHLHESRLPLSITSRSSLASELGSFLTCLRGCWSCDVRLDCRLGGKLEFCLDSAILTDEPGFSILTAGSCGDADRNSERVASSSSGGNSRTWRQACEWSDRAPWTSGAGNDVRMSVSADGITLAAKGDHVKSRQLC